MMLSTETQLPELSVYPEGTTIAVLAEKKHNESLALMQEATDFYGIKKMKTGDIAGRLINWRLPQEYQYFADEIGDTRKHFAGVPGVVSMQHSFQVGCISVPHLDENTGRVILEGTLDWEQAGENLQPVMSLAVLENPIKSEKPIVSAQTACGAFGIIVMNNQVAIKLDRAPIPNIKSLDADLSDMDEEAYGEIKQANNTRYLMRTFANSMLGRPSCAFLTRHAANKGLGF